MDMSCAQYSLLNVLIETKFQVEFEQDTAALVWVNKHKHLKDTIHSLYFPVLYVACHLFFLGRAEVM